MGLDASAISTLVRARFATCPVRFAGAPGAGQVPPEVIEELRAFGLAGLDAVAALLTSQLLDGYAVHRDDEERDIGRLAERILTYRVFPDAEGRMNRSLVDEGLGLLLVPQFTLAADTKKGTRASFTRAAEPAKGEAYFERLVAACREQLDTVETGRFGADMQVSLTNDGPVTFWLES